MQPPNIRTLTHQEWKIYKGLRLRALTESPDAFGRILAIEEKRTDASWINRLVGDNSTWNLPLVAEVGDESIGLAWGRIACSNPDVANLYQVWVATSHRGLGVGKLLVEAIITWAKAKNTRYLDLEVTLRDSAAMRLYTRLGFISTGELHPLRPGSEILSQQMRVKYHHQRWWLEMMHLEGATLLMPTNQASLSKTYGFLLLFNLYCISVIHHHLV